MNSQCFLTGLRFPTFHKKSRDFFVKTKKLETENRIFLSIEKRKLSLISDLLLKNGYVNEVFLKGRLVLSF